MDIPNLYSTSKNCFGVELLQVRDRLVRCLPVHVVTNGTLLVFNSVQHILAGYSGRNHWWNDALLRWRRFPTTPLSILGLLALQ